MVHRYIEKAGMQDHVTMHHRPALEVIPTLPAPFDLVFIDADKQNYPNYFDSVIGRMSPGGLIIADNVLWSGDVLWPVKEHDEQTCALVGYAERVHTGPRVAPVVVLLRDCLMLARIK